MSDPPPSAAPGIWEREDNGPALPPARGCPLPSRVRARGKTLLNQQFWLWGQDVRRDGNLLVRFGFELLRRPAGMQGSNLYVLPDEQIALWGFGLLARWPERPPIYLGRFRFEPRIPPPGFDARQVWQPDGVSLLTSPVGANAWAATLRPTLETSLGRCIREVGASGHQPGLSSRVPGTLASSRMPGGPHRRISVHACRGLRALPGERRRGVGRKHAVAGSSLAVGGRSGRGARRFQHHLPPLRFTHRAAAGSSFPRRRRCARCHRWRRRTP